MIVLDDLSTQLQVQDPEEKRLITGVSWKQYEALLAALDDSPGYRITYLEGVLEIGSPSRRHESEKERIGTQLEIYFMETDTAFFPLGSTTFRSQGQRGGTEPDKSYCLGTEKDFPDLAIEVVITSGGLDRLEVYSRLGVPEVWFWQDDRFFLYHRREDRLAEFPQTYGYELIPQSQLLLRLDIELLATFVHHSQPLTAAKEFRQRLRQQLDHDALSRS